MLGPRYHQADEMRDIAPMVSVIIATFNSSELFRRALTSVINQTHRNIEIIIVDDGSSDNTAQVVASFIDPRIRYIRHDRNMGVGDAYNSGLREAQGSLIAVLDHDDVAEPNWLSCLQGAFDDPAVAMAWSWRRQHDTIHGTSHIVTADPFKSKGRRKLPAMLTRTPGMSGLVFRSQVLDVVGLLDPAARSMADLDFTIRVALVNYWKVKIFPQVLIHKRAHAANLSNSPAAVLLSNFIWIMERHQVILRRYPCAYSHYLYHIGRLSESNDPKGANLLLAEAVRNCPSNMRYRFYLLLRRRHLRVVWTILTTLRSLASTVRMLLLNITRMIRRYPSPNSENAWLKGTPANHRIEGET